MLHKIAKIWLSGVLGLAGWNSIWGGEIRVETRPSLTTAQRLKNRDEQGRPSQATQKGITTMRPIGYSVQTSSRREPPAKKGEPRKPSYAAKKAVRPIAPVAQPQPKNPQPTPTTQTVQPIKPQPAVQPSPQPVQPVLPVRPVQPIPPQGMPAYVSPVPGEATGTLQDTYSAPVASAVQVPPLYETAQRLIADLNGLYDMPLSPEQETAITAVYFLISSYVGSPALVEAIGPDRCREIAGLLNQFLNPTLTLSQKNVPPQLMTQFQEFLRNNPNCRLVPQAQSAVVFMEQMLASSDPSAQTEAKRVLRAYIQLCLDLVQRRCKPDLLNRLATVQMQLPLAIQQPLTDMQKKTLKEESLALREVYDGNGFLDPARIDLIVQTVLNKILGSNLTQQDIVPEVFWAFSLVASTLGARDLELRSAAYSLLQTIRHELANV